MIDGEVVALADLPQEVPGRVSEPVLAEDRLAGMHIYRERRTFETSGALGLDYLYCNIRLRAPAGWIAGVCVKTLSGKTWAERDAAGDISGAIFNDYYNGTQAAFDAPFYMGYLFDYVAGNTFSLNGASLAYSGDYLWVDDLGRWPKTDVPTSNWWENTRARLVQWDYFMSSKKWISLLLLGNLCGESEVEIALAIIPLTSGKSGPVGEHAFMGRTDMQQV